MFNIVSCLFFSPRYFEIFLETLNMFCIIFVCVFLNVFFSHVHVFLCVLIMPGIIKRSRPEIVSCLLLLLFSHKEVLGMCCLEMSMQKVFGKTTSGTELF